MQVLSSNFISRLCARSDWWVGRGKEAHLAQSEGTQQGNMDPSLHSQSRSGGLIDWELPLAWLLPSVIDLIVSQAINFSFWPTDCL
jgi:hypothetical protein